MIKQIRYYGIVLFLVSINLYAGDNKHISLKGAVSFPTGNYSSINLEKGSFTTTGFSAGVEGAWFFYKNIGAGFDFNFSLHPVDAAALATETVIDDQFMEDLTIRSDPYNIKTYMLGLLYKIPMNKKINITPKLFGGLMYGRTPFQLFEASYVLIGPHSFKKTESRDHNFAIKGGVNTVFNINDCIGLGLYVDYTYSKLYFGFKTVSGTEIREKDISYLDIGLSLILKL